MSKQCAITFDTQGQGHALYTELVDLHSLGKLHIRRATRIEFSNKLQQWQVHDAGDDAVLYQSVSREACLIWEQEYFVNNTVNAGKENEEHAVCAGDEDQ